MSQLHAEGCGRAFLLRTGDGVVLRNTVAFLLHGDVHRHLAPVGLVVLCHIVRVSCVHIHDRAVEHVTGGDVKLLAVLVVARDPLVILWEEVVSYSDVCAIRGPPLLPSSHTGPGELVQRTTHGLTSL